MTSIEWLLEQLENYDNELPYYNSDAIIQAKEMHKQEIMNTYIIADSESTQEDSEHNALKFYERTYGSNGSDATSSQTEISDEEIKLASIERLKTRLESSELNIAAADGLGFIIGAEWYREQLKERH
jgi:hypothetical protein